MDHESYYERFDALILRTGEPRDQHMLRAVRELIVSIQKLLVCEGDPDRLRVLGESTDEHLEALSERNEQVGLESSYVYQGATDLTIAELRIHLDEIKERTASSDDVAFCDEIDALLETFDEYVTVLAQHGGSEGGSQSSR